VNFFVLCRISLIFFGYSNTNLLPTACRFVVIDLSAGPCTYGKIETEEGSVGIRSLPRLSRLVFPRGSNADSVSSTNDLFMGQLGALISTTIEHVIAPDIRYYYIFILNMWLNHKESFS